MSEIGSTLIRDEGVVLIEGWINSMSGGREKLPHVREAVERAF